MCPVGLYVCEMVETKIMWIWIYFAKLKWIQIL